MGVLRVTNKKPKTFGKDNLSLMWLKGKMQNKSPNVISEHIPSGINQRLSVFYIKKNDTSVIDK